MKKYFPIALIILASSALLINLLFLANPTEDCENLSDFYNKLGKLVIYNTVPPLVEKLCHNIIKAQRFSTEGNEALAMNELNMFIFKLRKNTPSYINDTYSARLRVEAKRLNAILWEKIRPE